MTPFLSGLVARAASAPQGAQAALPVVPPLFAVGPVIKQAVEHGDDRQDDGTPMNLGGEADPASFTAPTLSNDNRSVAQADARATAPIIRLGDRQSAASLASPVSRFADREPAPRRVPTFPARVPDSPHSILTERPHEQQAKVASGRPTHDVPRRVDVRAGPVIPAPAPPRQDRAIAPQLAPTVRVTIGRIEVRAITTPAPAQTVPPAAKGKRAAIVLEDYLRSGNAGR